MKDTATAFVGDMPRNYDRFLRKILFEPFAEDLARRVAVDQPATILELACGTGVVTAKLAEKLPNATLVATDISEDMLAIARQNVPGKVEWAIADAHDPGSVGTGFDAVVCQFGVMFLEDRVRCFTEVRKLLSGSPHPPTPSPRTTHRGEGEPGAFHFSTWAPIEENPIANLAHRTLVEMFPDDPPRFFTVPFGYADEALIRSELDQAGYSSVSIKQARLFSGSSPANDAAYGFIRGGPLAAALSERGADLNEVTAKLEVALKSEFGDPVVSPLSAWVVRAAG